MGARDNVPKAPPPPLVPIPDTEQRRNKLMEHWAPFYFAPPSVVELRCWLCGRAAAYLTSPEQGWCAKHARDF